MTIRGSSISIVREDKPLVSPATLPIGKSWAELEAFFKRERQAEGRQYKKDINKQLQEYRGWVFSAIDCIVDRMGSVKFKFFRKDTGEELTTSSKIYKTITKPIMYPNDYMSFEFILQWCQVQLDLCGKACLYRKKNVFGKTWELWPLDMNYFEGIAYENSNPDDQQNNPLQPPQGFVFKLGEERLLFPPESVIWLRYPHPESLWDGFSPIQAQAYITDIDYYLEVYERGFFQNSARIDFILEHEGNIDEDDAQRIKDMWVTAFSGSKRSYQPVVTGGGVRVVPITYTNKDFQFLEMSNWTKDRILGCYRVPEGKLGLFGDINRANQKGLDITFNEEAIRPRLDLWDKEITKQLIWPEFSEKIEMKFDNPVPRDREMDLKELELRGGKKTPINTVNELRNWWEGMTPVPGGDVILIDNKLIPLTSAGKVDPSDGDADKPSSGTEDPEYDPEYDPGGDESEKRVQHPQIALDYAGWDEALQPILDEYNRVLAHTNGWSYVKAENYAAGNANVYMGDKVKSLFVDSIKYEMSRDQFRKRLVSLLIEQVSARMEENLSDRGLEDISERIERIEAKVSDQPAIDYVPEAGRRMRSLKVIRDEDGFIAGLEEEEAVRKMKVVRDKNNLIAGLQEEEDGSSTDQEGDA